MKIKFEQEINNCYECPFHHYVSEQGFCADACKFISYGAIPKTGILENCPFKKNLEKDIDNSETK